MNKQEIIKALEIEIPSELSEFLKSGHDDLSDYCHESAYMAEDVIYYAKAEALYNFVSSKERDQAEETVEDCGGFGEKKTMADRFTVLAYWIVYNRLAEAIREQGEELAEAITAKVNELEEFAGELEDL